MTRTPIPLKRSIRSPLFPSIVLSAYLALGGVWARSLPPPPAEDPNVYYQEGVEANKNQDYKKAVDRFEKAYALESGESVIGESLIKSSLYRALQNYSIDLARAGDAGAAIEACSRAITLFPSDITTASNLAIFFNNRAVELLNGVKMTDSREALRDAGPNAEALDGALEAIETAEEVVNRLRFPKLREYVDPTHAWVYILKGRHEYLCGETTEALKFYDQSTRLNPRETVAYLDRSRIYAQQRRYDEAIADLREVQLLAPSRSAKIESLIDRLGKEAEALNIPLTGSSDFFEVEMIGGTPDEERVVRNELKEIRHEIATALQVVPRNQLVATVDWSAPLVRVPELLGAQPPSVTSQGFRVGANGASLSASDFRDALEFNYVLALQRNLSDDTVPYWFASGVAQILVGGETLLDGEERSKLLAAEENSQLLGTDRLSWANLAGLDDSPTLRLANLEAKALVVHVVDVIGISGLGSILNSMKEGVAFGQSLRDVTGMDSRDLDEEWRRKLGIVIE